MKRELVFSEDNLNKVFPFHIILNRRGGIESTGQALGKLIPGLQAGATFEEEFEWISPVNPSVENWIQRTGRLLVFRHRTLPSLTFKGHFEELKGSNCFAFFGNPALSSMDHLESLGLEPGDLALNDSLEDLLQVLKTNEIVTQKLTSLLKQVTDQRKALAREKRNLQHSNEQLSLFRSLINSSSDAVRVMREDGSLYYMNQTEASRLGIPQETIEIQEDREFRTIENWSNHLDQLRSVEFLTLEDQTVHQPSNKKIDVEITSKLIYIAGEGYIVSFSRDISERKLGELKLAQALNRAEEASEAKEAFLANMSHEIRTPLNGMMGMVRELRKMELDGRPGEYIFRTEKAIRHLYSLVNNALDITRIEAGELELERICFSMPELLKDVQAIFEAEAESCGLELKVDLESKMPQVYWGDVGRLRQILINLTGNSIKFTRQGHVKISCTAGSGKEKGQTVRFSVEDTGIGMSAEYQEKMFQKFQQEEAATARKYGGSGLGLFITRELIGLMGGKVKVHSVLGEGTRMEVDIELEVGQAKDLPKQKLLEIPSGIGQARVLLVEDNPMNRLVAVNALQELSVEVTEASNGEQAVKLLKENVYHLVLMDLQMPVMDGMEATRIIRKEMQLKVPIVALSANAFKSEIELCKSIGMNGYVTKPFEEMELIQVILDLVSPGETTISAHKPHFDLVKLRKMGKGNEAFVTKMLDIFVTMIPPTLKGMREAYQSGDWAALRKQAHQIKPSIDNMGISSLFSEIRVLEKATGQANHDGEIPGVLNRLTQVLEESVQQVNVLLKSRQ